MNRTKKNIIMIIIAVLLAGSMVFTSYSAAGSLTSDMQMPGQGQMQGGPPDMQNQGPGSDTDSDSNNGDSDTGDSDTDSDSDSNSGTDQNSGQNSDQNGQPPTPPDGNSNNGGNSQPPDMNSNGQPPNMDGNGQPPEMNGNGQPPEMNGDGQPPDMNGDSNSDNGSGDNGNSDNSSGDSDSTDNSQGGAPDGNMPDMKDMKGGPGSASMSDISAKYYVLFGAEALAFALILMYLIMSGMNQRTFAETFSSRSSRTNVTNAGADNTGASNTGAGNTGEDFTEPALPAGGTDEFADIELAGQESVSGQADNSVAGFDPIADPGAASSTNKTQFSGKKIAAYVVAVLLIAGALVPAQAALATKAFAGAGNDSGQEMRMPGGGQESESAEATGATTVDGNEETLNNTYTSSNADENAILVTNGGTLTSDGATINKESGDSSNTESSDFSGVNSGLLVQENSTATVKNATIKTSAKGANAVFATGENAKITISDSKITTTGESSSRGLDATYGGTIEADNVTITTQGGSCAAMATDRGEGTVSAVNSTLETNGAGSPVIYSTGNITLTDSTGTANGAQIAVVEGKNSATIEDSEVTCSAAGNRGDVDIAGVMIYQSMSGDADEGTGNFTAKDSVLSIDKDSNYYKTAPMFFVTNTDAVIDLTDTDLNFGSGVLLSAQGTSEWGNEGSNGGNVTFNATDQELKGDIELDELSSLTMTLKGSTYKGTINGDNTAESVSLTLDKDTEISLTGDSYVTSLEDEDSSYNNINFNGYTLYVDGEAIN